MAYEKNTWVSGTTPCSADNFNHMEDGIAAAHEAIAEQNTKFAYGNPTLTDKDTYANVAQLYYSKAGNTTTVYVSIKTQIAWDAGTALTLTGLPQAVIEQSLRSECAYGRGQIEITLSGTTATLTNLTAVTALQWVRFAFSYINA